MERMKIKKLTRVRWKDLKKDDKIWELGQTTKYWNGIIHCPHLYGPFTVVDSNKRLLKNPKDKVFVQGDESRLYKWEEEEYGKF